MTGGAIVTGSDSGIGRATAVALARRGLAVGITWHTDEAGAHETARLAGGDTAIARLDLTAGDAVGDVIAPVPVPRAGEPRVRVVPGG